MAMTKGADGVRLHYEVFGGGRRTWVFLHGWGSEAGFWTEFVTKHFDLRKNRAVCLSFRGHGLSDKPATGFSYEQFAADVLAVADAVGAKEFELVGFSMGGKFAQFISAKHPARVRRQILIAPVGPEVLPLEREPTLALCRAASAPIVARNFFAPWVKKTGRMDLFDRFVDSVTRTPARVLEQATTLMAWETITAQVKGTRTPTLIVAGSEDPVYPPAYQRQHVAPFMADASVKILPCGHFIPIEMPDECAEAMIQT